MAKSDGSMGAKGLERWAGALDTSEVETWLWPMYPQSAARMVPSQLALRRLSEYFTEAKTKRETGQEPIFALGVPGPEFNRNQPGGDSNMLCASSAGLQVGVRQDALSPSDAHYGPAIRDICDGRDWCNGEGR
jgi:hypothetical protein